MPDQDVRIAQTGLLAEVSFDRRNVAQAGLLVEASFDRRNVAQVGLMVEVYHVPVPRSFCVIVG